MLKMINIFCLKMVNVMVKKVKGLEKISVVRLCVESLVGIL